MVTVLLAIMENCDPKQIMPVVYWFDTLLFVIIELGQPFFWNPTNNPHDAPSMLHPVIVRFLLFSAKIHAVLYSSLFGLE